MSSAPLSSPTFVDLYKKLNPRQKEAVDTIYGPLMIIAGPGTGKTQILSLRIANILQLTDTTPDSILALTFTESAAHSMRRRLVDIIGSAAYRVNITTFHSFCNNIIRDFPDEFPRIIGARPASDIRQIGIIEKIILSAGSAELSAENNFSLLKPFGDPSYYVLPSLHMIRNLKRENISAAHFEKLVLAEEERVKNAPDRLHEKGAHKGKLKADYRDLEKQIEKNKELVRVYALYEKVLLEERLYDYEDMILETIRTLEENAGLLLELQENYQFILADEHQDANAAQNRILELLASFDDSPNICVVGDEKQAIFRFQGASLENFLSFKKKFPKAKIVSLEENYRSRQPILDAAHNLILKNNVEDESLRAKLVAAGDFGGAEKDAVGAAGALSDAAGPIPAINLREFAEESLEFAYLAHDIEQKIKNGASPRSIAVIYRENRDAFPIIRAFEKVVVPYVVRSDQNVLADVEIRKLITLFRAVLEPSRDEFIGHILYFDFLNLDPLEVSLVTDWARQNRQPILRALSASERNPKIAEDDARKFKELARKIKSWSVIARNSSATKAFEKIAKDSGFISHILDSADSPNLLLKVDALFREAGKLLEINRAATLHDFAKYLDTVDDYDVLIRSDRSGLLDSAVELMTAHKSKGLEFEHVYIVGVVDKHWGNKRDHKLFRFPAPSTASESAAADGAKDDSSAANSTEDERRLFYVALTRAKHSLFVSFSRRDAEGRDRLPSQFIQEIDSIFIKNEDVSSAVRELAATPAIVKDFSASPAPRLLDKTFLNARFLEQGLSVTALNNFLDCPWKYFFLNLIRLPSAQNRSQLYGVAIHAALKQFFGRLADGGMESGAEWQSTADETRPEASKEYLIASFKKMLARQPLKDEDLAVFLERGTDALSGYFDAYSSSWITNTISEYGIAGVFVDLPDFAAGASTKILIRGKLDKIEFLSDARVNVVDYKTAKPKTRNDILGETKNSSGDYFRQLVFYRLLLDGHEDGKYFMESGEIDFVEPNEKSDGKKEYKKEKFFIEDAHIEELTETIRQTARDILNLSFVEKDCGKNDCEFCALRKTLLTAGELRSAP
ncbi:MAG: ATP-dependent DNA helicase [Patescibacteria group bacterium]